jgi:hypothetical protein
MLGTSRTPLTSSYESYKDDLKEFQQNMSKRQLPSEVELDCHESTYRKDVQNVW